MSAKRTPPTITGNDPDSKIPAFRYTSNLANQLESKWQDHWEDEGTFEAPNPAGPLAQPERVAGREKLFVLDMFPYPSGAGLHVGHPLGYIATDVFARYKRMIIHESTPSRTLQTCVVNFDDSASATTRAAA